MSDSKALADIIDAQIRASGPMSLSTYMRLCLTHPQHGYYKTADPLGIRGDFITAPEISQMFGEFVGLWIANTWLAMGKPAPFKLVELGPGRGTLMEDALRVFSRVDGLTEAAELMLLETNPALIEAQRRRLGRYNPRWISEIDDLDGEDAPLIVIANEFFDVLPIKQFQKHNGQWHERAIGLKDGKRAWGLAPIPLPSDALPEAVRRAEDGAVWELGAIALETMAGLTHKLVDRQGVLLVFDYGYAPTRTGDTFQAIEKHEYTDPLANPGKADLTAHVDFEALARAAISAGGHPLPIVTQGRFLKALGIDERAEALASANPQLAEEIAASKNRLVADDQMGSLFKVLCVTGAELPLLPFADPQDGAA